MADGNEIRQAVQGWRDRMIAQQQGGTQQPSQMSQSQADSPSHSLGTERLNKGATPDTTGSLGVMMAMDSQSSLGVERHKFSETSASLKLTELRASKDGTPNNE